MKTQPKFLADLMREVVEPDNTPSKDFNKGWNAGLEAAKLTVTRPDLKNRREIVKEIEGLRL